MALALCGCVPEGRAEVTVGFRGMGQSDPFAFSGNYAMSWFAQADSDTGCSLEASLMSGSRGGAIDLVVVSVPAGQRLTGGHDVGSLEKGDYFVTATSTCDWRINFKPI